MKTIKKLTEPFAYIILVAAFGFITTVVNHSRSTRPVSDSNLMSLSSEQQFEAFLTGNMDSAKEIVL